MKVFHKLRFNLFHDSSYTPCKPNVNRTEALFLVGVCPTNRLEVHPTDLVKSYFTSPCFMA
jgi:hypothetical protein